MNTIISSDRVFATVSECGTTIFRSTFQGMNSLEEVVAEISRSIRGIARGMVTLVLRNASQGWIARVPVRLGVQASAPRQLTLF